MNKPSKGRFVLHPETPQEVGVWNKLLNDGMELFLKQIFQADATQATYYVGLMGSAYDKDTTLADIVGVSEPTIGTNGYARIALNRDSTDWPDIAMINSQWRARSKLMTFTAAGGNFDRAMQRMFICSVANGSVGKLFAVSGLFPAALTVTPATPLPVKYESWLF